MNTALSIAQIVVVVLLVITILMQQRGSSLGAAFGGGGESFGMRRGAEKFIYYSSIVLSVLFLGLALFSFLIQG